MTDHKFEPFQQVLVRYNVGGGATWSLQHFSHLTEGECPFNSITGYSFAQCIPYTTETAHLIGTSDHYEPPKPPHEYRWGDKVEVNYDGTWRPAIFIGPYSFNALGIENVTVLPRGRDDCFHCPYELIRPAAPTS